MRVATAGWELRVVPVRELVDEPAPVLPPDCELEPPAGADGADGAGAVADRVGVVTIRGATGFGAGGLVTDGVVAVTGGVLTVTGGVLTVTGGAGAGGSAVVTGTGGGGGSAVVTGSGGGGGSAVVTGSEGVVTVTPGRGGTSRASAWAATRPAKAAPRPQRPPRRDILKCTTCDP